MDPRGIGDEDDESEVVVGNENGLEIALDELNGFPRYILKAVIAPNRGIDVLGLDEDHVALVLGVVLRVTEGLDGVPNQGIYGVTFLKA